MIFCNEKYLCEEFDGIIMNFYKNKQSNWFANLSSVYFYLFLLPDEICLIRMLRPDLQFVRITHISVLFIIPILRTKMHIEMLSKNKIKLIQSLNRKKGRDESGLFLVEGNKMVEEALRSDFNVETLISTPSFLGQLAGLDSRAKELVEADKESIQKASLLQTPQDSMALVRLPANTEPEITPNADLMLALDFIQDPGNLGTILRIADWFGINTVICSENTVDAFNPKVVQASMGAIFRTNTVYTNLEKFLAKAVAAQLPVYGTFLDGKNIYTEPLSAKGIIVLGNEGNGISDPVSRLVTQKLVIPTFSTGKNKPESLNVAIATAICCSEFRRR